MSKQASRREFLRATSIPLVTGLSGLPLAGAGRPLLAMNAGASPERGESPGSIVVENSSLPVQVQEAVLFSFDDQSIPFSSGLKLDLLMGKKPGHANPIVVRQGQPGEPDSERVRYYGTVIEVGEELRMWYLGRGDKYDPSGGPLRLLYAVSKDGIHWEKPKLALIDYNGRKVEMRASHGSTTSIRSRFPTKIPAATRRCFARREGCCRVGRQTPMAVA